MKKSVFYFSFFGDSIANPTNKESLSIGRGEWLCVEVRADTREEAEHKLLQEYQVKRLTDCLDARKVEAIVYFDKNMKYVNWTNDINIHLVKQSVIKLRLVGVSEHSKVLNFMLE